MSSPSNFAHSPRAIPLSAQEIERKLGSRNAVEEENQSDLQRKSSRKVRKISFPPCPALLLIFPPPSSLSPSRPTLVVNLTASSPTHPLPLVFTPNRFPFPRFQKRPTAMLQAPTRIPPPSAMVTVLVPSLDHSVLSIEISIDFDSAPKTLA